MSYFIEEILAAAYMWSSVRALWFTWNLISICIFIWSWVRERYLIKWKIKIYERTARTAEQHITFQEQLRERNMSTVRKFPTRLYPNLGNRAVMLSKLSMLSLSLRRKHSSVNVSPFWFPTAIEFSTPLHLNSISCRLATLPVRQIDLVSGPTPLP